MDLLLFVFYTQPASVSTWDKAGRDKVSSVETVQLTQTQITGSWSHNSPWNCDRCGPHCHSDQSMISYCNPGLHRGVRTMLCCNMFSFQHSAIYQEVFPRHQHCPLFMKCPIFHVIGVFFTNPIESPKGPVPFLSTGWNVNRELWVLPCVPGDMWALRVTWRMELAKGIRIPWDFNVTSKLRIKESEKPNQWRNRVNLCPWKTNLH